MNGGSASVVIVVLFVGAFGLVGFSISENSRLAAENQSLKDRNAALQAENEDSLAAAARWQQATAERDRRLQERDTDLALARQQAQDLRGQLDACARGRVGAATGPGPAGWDWLPFLALAVAGGCGAALGSSAVMVRGARGK